MASPLNHSNKRSELMVIGCECTQQFYASMAIILQAIQKIRSDLNESLVIECAGSICLVLFSVPLRMYTHYQC